MTSSGKEPPADERKREIEAQVAAKDKAEAKKPQRSELETGRRLAFVLELIARGEVKAKMPKGAPLSDGLEVPERDLPAASSLPRR